MARRGTSEVIATILAYINVNYEWGTIVPRIQFNNLDLIKDSLGVMIKQDSYKERFTSVVSRSKEYSLNLDLVFRVKSSKSGSTDLDSIELVDDIVDFIVSNYKEVTSSTFMNLSVERISDASLSAFYESGEKEFSATLKLTYERW